MAIFNEAFIGDIIVLNEKKTHEEYAKEKFKKKYNFVPDKPGSSKGTIEVDGKKYNIDINSDTIESKTGDKNGSIGVDNRFFKLKGSNKSERRDAALYHEIGHQSLHNSNPKSETVDSKNRSQKYFRKEIKNSIKNKTGADIDDDPYSAADSLFRDKPRIISLINRMPKDKAKEFIYKNGFDEDDYLKDSKKEDQDRRDKDFEKAKKFEKPKNPHLRAEEFEADRYAANRTSERAVKKSLANYNKISKKDSKLSKDVKSDVAQEDFKQRSKALKDEDLRDAKTYK